LTLFGAGPGGVVHDRDAVSVETWVICGTRHMARHTAAALCGTVTSRKGRTQRDSKS